MPSGTVTKGEGWRKNLLFFIKSLIPALDFLTMDIYYSIKIKLKKKKKILLAKQTLLLACTKDQHISSTCILFSGPPIVENDIISEEINQDK